MTNKGIFLNLFRKQKSELVPDPFLFLINLSIKRDWVQKKKRSQGFFKIFWLSYSQICCFLKKLLHAMVFLSYLLKLKRGLGLGFGGHFLHDIFHKSVSYLMLYQWTKLQCHNLFLSQDIKQNALLSSYLDSWWRQKL